MILLSRVPYLRMILECLKRSNTPNIMYSCGINCDFVKKSILHSKYNLTIQTIPTILFGTLLAHSGGVGDTVPFEQNTTILQSEHNLTIQMQSSQSFLAHIWHKGGSGSWLPYSTYLYLDFHLFHDEAKRTQQGNLLGGEISSDLYRFVQCDIKKCAFVFLKLEQNPWNCD